VSGVWCLAFGVWRLASGVWHLVSGVWHLVYRVGVSYIVHRQRIPSYPREYQVFVTDTQKTVTGIGIFDKKRNIPTLVMTSSILCY